MFDLVVRRARIVDGSGDAAREGDLAVSQGRIVKIGKVLGDAAVTVDAGGQVLAPGIIDVHTHYDAQLTWDPTCSPSPALGVTTVVIGNCGFGIAPATPQVRDLLLKNLSVVEAMSLESLRAGVEWGFEDFAEYLAMIRRKGTVPNVAAYASHSAIRSVVMGEAASERAATNFELDAMVTIFRDCMDAGAMGLGSSTFENHNGWGGKPVPSRLAADNEFRAFARVVGDAGHGSMMATCGERTTISFLEELATISGRPTVYAPLLYYSSQPDRAHGIARECELARRRGHPVYAQASCQPLSMDFRLTAAYPMLTLSGWPSTDEKDPLRRIFADMSFRDQVRKDLQVSVGTRIFNGHWDRVELTIAQKPALRPMEGRTIAEIATMRSADPLDTFFDVGLEDDLETVFTAKLLNVEEDKVAELLRMDGNMVSLSDAGAHHTFFCDAGFGPHFLGHWVREKQLFSIETAARKLSSELADIYGLPDRGRLAKGYWADMILFDPDRIGISKTDKVSDLPAGGARLIRHAPGLLGTFVNGVEVFDGKDYVRRARPPGQVLTRFSRDKPTIGMNR